ncbi:MAG TPA: hypothetical protein VKP78_09275 [bacterium]|nr:hypothetical protein [bacterium]
MTNKFFKFLIGLSSIILIINCSTIFDNEDDHEDSGNTYNYEAFDSTGKKIVTGTLELQFTKLDSSDNERITGSWNLSAASDSGTPQAMLGEGELIGEWQQNNRLWLNLHPHMMDNNVFLNGNLEEDEYTGEWSYATFAGVVNYGTFEARKK